MEGPDDSLDIAQELNTGVLQNLCKALLTQSAKGDDTRDW